jgi:hypothetical protein
VTNDVDRSRAQRRDSRWAAALAALFFCVAAVGVVYHELWRDEWQAWLIARDTTSIGSLLSSLRHDGHPPLWNLLLFLLGRLTRNPLAMQGIHLAIATTSIYLLARFAPLPRLHKVLLAFSYFLAYEYAVIARPYALGVLALFAFCALVPVRQRHPAAVFAALLVLAGSSVYGLILSATAGGMLLIEMVVSSNRDRPPFLHSRTVRIGVFAWLTGLGIALVAIRPPAGFTASLTSEASFSRWSLAATASTLSRAYLPFPDVASDHIWSTQFLATGNRSALALSLALSITMGIGGVLLFLRKPSVLFMYVVGTASLLAFRHFVFLGSMRHHGQLFLLFVACLWLAGQPMREWQLPDWLYRWSETRTRWGALLVTGILLVQVAAAAVLYVADLRGHFSAAPLVATFIRERGLDQLPIGASPAPAASSVAGLLDRPIYYLATGAPGTFVRWARYPRVPDRNPSMDLIRPFLESESSAVLLLLGSEFEDWDPGLMVEELARFPAGLEPIEKYVLYRVTPAAR